MGNVDTKPQPSAVEGLGSPPCVFWVQLPLAAASVTLLIPTYSEHCVLNIHFDGQEARGRELLMTALRKNNKEPFLERSQSNMFPSLHFSGKSLTIFESLGQCLMLPSLLASRVEMAVLV